MQEQEPLMTQAQAAPTLQVWETLMKMVRDGNDAALLQGAPAWAKMIDFDVLLGTNSTEADGTKPRPDKAIEGPCLDMVVHSSGPSVPRCTALSNMVPALGFSGATNPGVAGPGLPGSPSSSSPLDN
jgi:hypothetical protein